MSKSHEIVLIPGLVNIISNVKKINWLIFGEELLDVIKPTRPLFKVKYYVVKGGINVPYGIKILGPWFVNKEEDLIYLKRSFPLTSFELVMRKIDSHSPSMLVNRAMSYLRFPTGWLLPPGLHLSSIISVKLMKEGYLPLHASSVASEDGTGLVFLALADVGKTLTAISMVKRGYKFVSEDMVVTDGRTVISCPLTNTYGFYKDISRLGFLSLKDKLGVNFNRFIKLPVLSQYLGYQISVLKYLKFIAHLESKEINNAILTKCKLGDVFLLQQSNKDSIIEADRDQLINEIKYMNMNEFWWYRDPLILAYSYFKPTYDVGRLLVMHNELISHFVDSAKRIFIVKSRHPRLFSVLIDKVMKV